MCNSSQTSFLETGFSWGDIQKKRGTSKESAGLFCLLFLLLKKFLKLQGFSDSRIMTLSPEKGTVCSISHTYLTTNIWGKY